jgi:hypothetical protein
LENVQLYNSSSSYSPQTMDLSHGNTRVSVMMKLLETLRVSFYSEVSVIKVRGESGEA